MTDQTTTTAPKSHRWLAEADLTGELSCADCRATISMVADAAVCPECQSTNLGDIDPRDNTIDCLDCGIWFVLACPA